MVKIGLVRSEASDPPRVWYLCQCARLAASPGPAARRVVSAPALLYPNLALCVTEVSHEKPTSLAEMLRGRNSIFCHPPSTFSFFQSAKERDYIKSRHAGLLSLLRISKHEILEISDYPNRALNNFGEAFILTTSVAYTTYVRSKLRWRTDGET